MLLVFGYVCLPFLLLLFPVDFWFLFPEILYPLFDYLFLFSLYLSLLSCPSLSLYRGMRLQVNFNWRYDSFKAKSKIIPGYFRLAELNDEIYGSQENNYDRSEYYQENWAETDTATRVSSTIVFENLKKLIANFKTVNDVQKRKWKQEQTDT